MPNAYPHPFVLASELDRRPETPPTVIIRDDGYAEIAFARSQAPSPGMPAAPPPPSSATEQDWIPDPATGSPIFRPMPTTPPAPNPDGLMTWLQQDLNEWNLDLAPAEFCDFKSNIYSLPTLSADLIPTNCALVSLLLRMEAPMLHTEKLTR